LALSAGTRLGVYEVTTQIGEGGMGKVYRARDTTLNRDVALKVLPESFANDPDRLVRFQREAQTLASLNHPHIAHVYGLEQSGGVRALVMELVEGDDLSQRLARASMAIDEALPIAKQIAEALEAAHEQGIIHRDLKPANIKVRADGTVKILDFGLAKAMEPPASSPNVSQSPTITMPAMTQAGMILGTAAYMSPEQARGKQADTRADIWAFGAVLYEMLTGRRAFGGDDVSQTLAFVITKEPDWSLLPSTTPSAIRRLLVRTLAKDPRERLQAIADARLELRDALAEPATPPATPAVAVRPSSRVAATLPWVLGALVGGGLATSLLVGRPPVHDLPLTRLDLVTPPTTDPFSFALSPDGRQIVFVAAAEGGSKLWLRSLDQTDARPLAGTEGASAPFWRPDGQALGFFADAKLKRIDLSGGAPQVLADASVARGGTWNRDGVIVFASTTVAASGASGLMQVAATGGAATALTRLARGQLSHYWPQFLPDDRRFLFFTVGPDTQGVYVGSLDGAEPTRVLAAESVAAYAPPGYLLLVSQGVLVARRFDAARGVVSGDPQPVAQAVGVNAANSRTALSVSATGVLAHRSGAAARRQLLWVDRAGKTLEALGQPWDGGQINLELAPDGQQVAVSRNTRGNADVWLIEVARGLASPFTFSPASERSALWSPDGSRLIFPSNRNGYFDLFEKPANGAADEQPRFVNPQDKEPLSWSKQFLLYAVQDPKTRSDLFALPLVGEPKPVPVATTSADEVQGQFSPDGRWVAYASNGSGRYEIYIRAFPSGGQWQVSTGGGVTPRWGHDGHELFYVAPDNWMMVAPILVASDARALSHGAPVPLFPSRLTAGIGVGGYSSRAQYAVAADGRFLLNVSADDAAASPITIVLNWTAGLKP
jgi:serine/threonine protein kinase/Tol biopolymer transport system component